MKKPVSHSSSFKTVLVSDLVIDPEAQRKLSPIWVKEHVPVFDVDQLGYIVINIRADGHKYVVDGMHRVALMRAVNWGDQNIHAEVFEGMTQAEEAKLFNARNDRRAVRLYDKFRIGVVAGNRRETSIQRIVNHAGLQISDQSRDGHITAVAALETIYSGANMKSELEGAAALTRTLRTLVKAWDNSAAAFTSKVLLGVGMVQLRYNGLLDQDALSSKLSTFKGGASGLLGSAKYLADASGKPLHSCLASVVVDHYNKGRRTGKIDEWSSKAD